MATATEPQTAPRTPLDRRRVLTAALALVDAEGLDALSMRRLGTELGVDAMSLYRHVANKDALLDGLVEQLWTEVGATTAQDGADWASQLRAFAHGVRAMMRRHPQAATLLFSRCVLAPHLLEAHANLLDALRAAGFDDRVASRTVRSMCSYAMGYASNELYCYGAWRADPGKPTAAPDAAPVEINTTEILLWLGRTLPANTPSRLVDAAMAMVEVDFDGDFEATLDMAIQGLRQLAPTG
jgi:TetR/AcrR family tetracycline transcriptional repressor